MTATDAIALNDLAGAQQGAHLRLLLHVTGEVHAAITAMHTTLATKVRSLADAEGHLPSQAIFGLETAATAEWADFWAGYEGLLLDARRQAALIPYGVLAYQHEALISEGGAGLTESDAAIRRALQADVSDILAATAQAKGPDDLTLSQRLWNLNREGRKGISTVLSQAISNDWGAYRAAAALEGYLGAGAECPRWTKERLRLSKGAIAGGDSTGLLTGSPCGEKGVAYAALRLARTEISAALNQATALAYTRSPWVTAVRIRISGSHPKPDDCDAHAAGGPNGGGVYAVGDQPLPPFHPHCLCFQEPVIADAAAFAARATAYTTTAVSDPPLDTYTRWLGRDRATLAGSLLPLLAGALIGWLTSDPNDMEDLRHDAP